MKGRKPKPTARRLLEGNAEHRPLNRDEPRPPAPDADFDAPPRELHGHAEAIAEWVRLAPMLRQSGQITLADRALLVALCVEWETYLVACRAVQREGLLPLPSGAPRGAGRPFAVNPHRQVARHALAACLRLWPELGLTPASRTRLKIMPLSPADDPFAEFDRPTH